MFKVSCGTIALNGPYMVGKKNSGPFRAMIPQLI